MKILISSSDFNLERGGIQNTGYILAQYMSKDAEIISFCDAYGDSPVLPGVLNYKSKFMGKAYLLFSFFELLSIYHKQRFDYALSTHYLNGFGLVFLKWFCGVRYGVMTHGNEVIMQDLDAGLIKRAKFALFTKFIRKLTFRNATNIFSNTTFTASLVKNICSNVSITVIHPPISMPPSTTTFANVKTHKLLTIGRLVKRKGCQDVIKSLPKVLEVYPDMKYVIAGEGEYETELKSLVSKLKLNDNVIFKGRVSDDEKCNLLAECGLFVMPSFYIKEEGSVEGFGITFVEANSFGKFVISTRSGGIPEAVIEGETGFLVAEHDIEGLSDAILKFYSYDFQYKHEKCKEWAYEHFIGNIAKQYIRSITIACS